MRRFTVLVIALALAPGILASVVPNTDIVNFPGFIDIDDVVARPFPETDDEVVARPFPEAVVPRPLPIAPEFLPETQPEFEAEVVPPILISLNPCDACFAYMTSLIDELAGVGDVEPEVEPEIETIPLPVPDGGDLRPLPLPVVPEVDVRPLPLPIPSEAEAEEELANQGRPLPTHIIRK